MSNDTEPPDAFEEHTRPDVQTPEAREDAREVAPPRPAPGPVGQASQSRLPGPPPLPGRPSRPPPRPVPGASASYVPPAPTRPMGSLPGARPSAPPPLRAPNPAMRPTPPPWSEDSTRKVMKSEQTGQVRPPTGQTRTPTGHTRSPTGQSTLPRTGSVVAPRPSSPPSSVRPSVPAAGRPSPSARPGPSAPPPGAADLRERIARLMTQLQAERDRVTKHEGEIGTLKSRVNLLDARLGELEEEVREHPAGEGDAKGSEELAERVRALEEMAEKVRAGDSALRGILDQQRKAVAEREGELSRFGERMREVERTVAALGATQGELREALSKKDEQLEAVRRELDERLSDIDGLRDALNAAVAEAQNLRAELDDRPTAEAPSEGGATKPYGPMPEEPQGDDDLKRIKGIGPKFEKALKKLGVRTYAQIAGWTDEDVESIAALIGTRAQRIQRDGWIAHARELSANDGGA